MIKKEFLEKFLKVYLGKGFIFFIISLIIKEFIIEYIYYLLNFKNFYKYLYNLYYF